MLLTKERDALKETEEEAFQQVAKVKELTEKVTELESSLMDKETKESILKQEKTYLKEKIKTLEFVVQEMTIELHKKMNSNSSVITLEKSKDLDTENKENSSLVSNLNYEIQDLKVRLSELELANKSLKSKFNKEKAILIQNEGFLKLTIENLQRELNEQKASYNKIIKSIENKSESEIRLHEDYMSKLEQMKREASEKEKRITSESNKIIKELQDENTQIKEKCKELEFKLANQTDDIYNENERLIEENSCLEFKVQNLKEKILQLSKANIEKVEELELASKKDQIESENNIED